MGFMTEIFRTVGKGRVGVAGSFRPNGSSAITASLNKGIGWSVAYTSTGLYTITFDKVWPDLISFTCNLQLASPATDHFLITGVYTAASKTITISHFTGGVLADIADNANNKIHFRAVFKNTLAPG